MPLSDPTLSVIFPVYNSEPYLEKALVSILKQTFQDFELLICDDGSTDDSWNVIQHITRGDERVTSVRNTANRGKNASVNMLYERIRGRYLTIHDSDDWSDPTRFEQQLNLLQSSRYLLCGCSFVNVDQNGSESSKIQMASHLDIEDENFFEQSRIHGPTMMFESDIPQRVGGLYRFFRNKEDVDFAVRVIERFPVTNLKDYLYYYRNHPDSLSKQGYDYLKFEGLQLIKKLHNERSENGVDSLMSGDTARIEAYLRELEEPYIVDKGLFWRKSAAHNMHFRFYRSAIRQAFIGVIRDPFHFVNYRTLLYCIRQSIADRVSKLLK